MTPVGGRVMQAVDRLGADRMAEFDKGFGADGIYVAVASQVVALARIVVVADRQHRRLRARHRRGDTLGRHRRREAPHAQAVVVLVWLLSRAVGGRRGRGDVVVILLAPPPWRSRPLTGTALILAGRDSMTARQGNANLVSRWPASPRPSSWLQR